MDKVLRMLVAMLALPGCASQLALDQDEALTVIPHRTGNFGHIVVDVMIDNHGPFTFAVDTGASISIIYENVRTTSLVKPVPGVRAHVLGMTGSGEFPVVDVEQISVGTEDWNNPRVVLLPQDSIMAREVDGILGVDFLSRYAVWYSQKDRVLRFYPRQVVARRVYHDWNSVDLSEMRVGDGSVTIRFFYIFISGERIPTIFDLGATFNVMNRKAARVLDVRARTPADTTKVYGVIGQIPILANVLIWRLRIESMYWRNRTFLVGEFPMFEALNLNRNPVAIAGISFFKERDFIVDFAGERLLVRAR